jgi:HEPN domain-containing protein
MKIDALINNFATRSFRDIADQDYIAARLSYKHGLFSQFHWQSLQAIEKYIKAILLYNRIKAKDINHDLNRAFKHAEKLPFEIIRSESTDNFIEHLTYFGRFRYLESSYFIHGPKLVELDKSVWEIRRYCTCLNHDIETPSGDIKNMLNVNLAKIVKSETEQPNKYRVIGGLLEKIVEKSDHPSRGALIWQNAYFSKSTRKTVTVPTPSYSVNSPLYLHPEILDEVLEYIFLPKEVVTAFREHGKKDR